MDGLNSVGITGAAPLNAKGGQYTPNVIKPSDNFNQSSPSSNTLF